FRQIREITIVERHPPIIIPNRGPGPPVREVKSRDGECQAAKNCSVQISHMPRMPHASGPHRPGNSHLDRVQLAVESTLPEVEEFTQSRIFGRLVELLPDIGL